MQRQNLSSCETDIMRAVELQPRPCLRVLPGVERQHT